MSLAVVLSLKGCLAGFGVPVMPSMGSGTTGMNPVTAPPGSGVTGAPITGQGRK